MRTPVEPFGWKTSSDPEVESARACMAQLCLFPPSPADVLERIGLSWLAADELYAGGWLSFDPRRLATLDEAQEAELAFMGSLAAAGCDRSMLARLLHGLRRPYQYRPGTIYLDWAAARWRLIPKPEEPDAESVFEDWLTRLMDEGDRQTLEKIESQVAAALNALDESESEEEDSSQ